jgi:hypothetical protein
MRNHSTKKKAIRPKVRRLKRPRLRTLTITVREEVAERLEASVGLRYRYGSIADVAAQIVEDYHELLEDADRDHVAFVEQQKRRVRKGNFKIVGSSSQQRRAGR